MFAGQLPHLARGSLIDKGGVGEIYNDPRDQSRCIKRFFTPKVGAEAAQLARLIQSTQWARPSEQHILETRFSWPVEGFGTPDRIVGFSMPKAPTDAYFELTAAGRTRTRLLQLKYLMDARYWQSAAVQSKRPEVGRQDRLVMAIELLDALEVIHDAGFVYGDVSSNNMCARVGSYPSVFLLDADSIVTPDVRLANPVRTPGWEVPEHLDPLSADRSLISLFIWRFLLEDPRSRPHQSGHGLLQRIDATTFGAQLIDGYETGDGAALTALGEAMRRERDDAWDTAAILRAERAGYARLILKEALEAHSPHEKALIQEARQQLLLEEQIESATPGRQRLLLSRREVSDSPLVLDLAPGIAYGNPPRSDEALTSLMFDARFAEIAIHFTQHGLGPLEAHPLLRRSMAHALVEAGTADFSVALKPELATVGWSWPAGRFVNVMELEIFVGGTSRLRQEVLRDPASRRTERSLRLPRGGKVRIRARRGIRSPSGTQFFEIKHSEYQFEVPGAPPARTTTRVPGNVADGPVVLIDEAAEAKRMAEAEAQRKKRQRARILTAAAAAVVVASGGGTGAWLVARHDATSRRCPAFSTPPITACTYELIGRLSRSDLFRLDTWD
jgi:hypothetical protein